MLQIKLADGTVYPGGVEDVDIKSDLATIRINPKVSLSPFLLILPFWALHCDSCQLFVTLGKIAYNEARSVERSKTRRMGDRHGKSVVAIEYNYCRNRELRQ